MNIPEELGNLVILLAFLLPPFVAVLKGYLGLGKKGASISVILICILFAVVGAIYTGQIVVGVAALTVIKEVIKVAAWILMLAFALYKMVFQPLGLDDWIVLKTSRNNNT